MFLQLFTKKVTDFELIKELQKEDKWAWKCNLSAKEAINALYGRIRFVKTESLQSEQLIQTIDFIKQAKRVSGGKSEEENRITLNEIQKQIHSKRIG